MLEYLIRKSTIKNPPLLVMIHGYGSNKEDLFSFAKELPKELLIISIQAPLSLGFGSYAWYSINFDASANKFSDLNEARESLNKIELFLETIKVKYAVNSDNIFVLGFSQGAILSYALALRNPSKINNIIALSGYLNTDLIPKDLTPDTCKNLDFFISHGTVDQVLPIDWVRNSLPILDQLEIKYAYNEYPVGHGINPQNFNDFKIWIENKLSQ